MEKIIRGGTEGNSFWRIRETFMKTNNQNEYDQTTEYIKEIQEPKETKEYIGHYFEELYQAKEGEAKYEEWTDKVKEKNKIAKTGTNWT